MKTFKTVLTEGLLLEAYSRDKTWNNFKDKIVKRASEPLFWQKKKASARGGVDRLSNDQHQQIYPDNVHHKTYGDVTGHEGQTTPFKAVWDDHMIPSRFRTQEASTTELKNDLMNHIEESVPHPKYVPTVTRFYAEGKIPRVEDIGTTAAELVGDYHKLATHNKLSGDSVIYNHDPIRGPIMQRTTIPETDFKRFRSLEDFQQVIHHHQADMDEIDRKKVAELGKDDYTKVHEDENVTVYHPHTYEAAKALSFPPDGGSKCLWCTGANSKEGKRLFDNYNDQGPLLIFHPKKPEYKGEAYQGHVASDQFMNEKDNPSDFLHSYKDTKERFPGLGLPDAVQHTYQHAYDHPETIKDTDALASDGDFHQFVKALEPTHPNDMKSMSYHQKVKQHFWPE